MTQAQSFETDDFGGKVISIPGGDTTHCMITYLKLFKLDNLL